MKGVLNPDGLPNPDEKYEPTSEDVGRSRREKNKDSMDTQALNSPPCGIHSSTEIASMKARGYLSTPPAHPERALHPAIDRELERSIKSDADLRQTISDAVRTLTREMPSATINAILEHDHEEPETTRPVIEVRADFDDVDHYRSLKTRVQEIVRDAERGDAMVYTRISRA
ncbi:MAG: hypothetical protein ACOCYZ_02160 [Halococcoides sp.]